MPFNSAQMTRSSQLIIVAMAAAVICAWFWLQTRRWKQERNRRIFFPAIIVAGVLVRLGYVLFTPLFYTPDEEPHFNYVVYLSEQQAFPIQKGKWDDGSKDWEYSQPPLYYLTMVPVYRAAEGLFHSRTVTVRILRLAAVAFWLVNVWVGVFLLRRLGVEEDRARWLFVMALICLLPTYTFISSAINNDNLLTVLGTCVLFLMAAPRISLGNSFASGIVLGLALLTKQSAVIFIPAFVFLAAMDWVKQRRSLSSALLHLVVVLGCAALFYWPWAIRNWHVYGTFKPEYLVPWRVDWPSPFYGMASAVHNLLQSFWSVSGVSNNIGYPFPLVGMLFLFLGFLCVGRSLTGMRSAFHHAANDRLIAAFLVAVFVNVLLVLRFGYLFGMGQGRHLFPVLYPIALILAWVWRHLPSKNLELHTTVAWIIYAFAFQLFSLYRFPLENGSGTLGLQTG